MHRSIILITTFLILVCGSAFAQGEYLEKGQSGLKFEFGFLAHGKKHVSAVSIGITPSAVVDFSIAFGSGNSQEGSTIAPAMILHPLNNNGHQLLPSLSIEVELAIGKDDNTDFLIAGILHNEILIGRVISIMPYGGYGIISYYQSTYYYGSGLSYSSETGGVSIGGLSILIKPNKSRKVILHFGPKVEYFGNDTYVGASFGITGMF